VASETVQILLKARDEATAVINRVQGELAALSGPLGRIAVAGGPFGALVAGAAAAAGGIVAMGKAIADNVEQLDRLAKLTGVGIERLQVLRQVIEEDGGSAESLTGALTNLNRSIATQDPLLKQLGIVTHDTYSAFTQLVEILNRSADTAKVTEIAFRLMGKGSADLIGNLGALATRVEKSDERMRKYGALITEETAPASRELDKQLDELSLAWKGLATSMQTLVVPAATATVKAFGVIAEGARELVRALSSAEAGIKSLMEAHRRFQPGAAMGSFLSGVAPPASTPAPAKDSLAGINLGPGKKAPQPPSEADWAELWEKLARKAMERNEQAQMLDEETEKLMQQAVGKLGTFETKTGEVLTRAQLERRNVILGWEQFTAELLSSASVLNASIGAVFTGLESGLTGVLSRLGDKTQTVMGAIKDVVASVGQEIAKLLAELAAAAIVKSALGFGPLSWLKGGAGGGGGGGGVGPGFGESGWRRATVINNHFEVSAFDKRGIVESLTSPNGALRAAFADAALRRLPH
jgi:hypothetical protein